MTPLSITFERGEVTAHFNDHAFALAYTAYGPKSPADERFHLALEVAQYFARAEFGLPMFEAFEWALTHVSGFMEALEDVPRVETWTMRMMRGMVQEAAIAGVPSVGGVAV